WLTGSPAIFPQEEFTARNSPRFLLRGLWLDRGRCRIPLRRGAALTGPNTGQAALSVPPSAFGHRQKSHFGCRGVLLLSRAGQFSPGRSCRRCRLSWQSPFTSRSGRMFHHLDATIKGKGTESLEEPRLGYTRGLGTLPALLALPLGGLYRVSQAFRSNRFSRNLARLSLPILYWTAV